MKLTIHIVACLLFTAAQPTVFSASVAVQVIGTAPEVRPLELTQIPFKSGPAIRIAVALNGKPLPRATVEFYRYETSGRPKTPTFTLLCDKYGWLKAAQLSSGLYAVTVHAQENLQGDLLLQVSSRYGNRPTAFGMELLPPEHAPVQSDVADADDVPMTNGFQGYLAEAAKAPITDRLQAFRGVVTDPGGAVIPKVVIQLVHRGAGETKTLNQIKSGPSGEFEAQLDPGTYVAIFSAPGFKTKIVGFQIVPEGSDRLSVALDIANASEQVTLE